MARVNPESGLQIVKAYLEKELGPLPFKGPVSEVPINPQIAYDAEVKISVVKAATTHFRGIGLLTRPASREETREILSKSKSFNPRLEEEWDRIAEYAVIGMAPREIRHALLFEKGVDINPHVITQRMFKARKTDQLDQRSEEDQQNIRSTMLHPTEEQIKGRVRLWVNVFRTAKAQDLPMPKSRLEWIGLVNLMQSQEDLLIGDGEKVNFFNHHARWLPVEQVEGLKMWLVDWMEKTDFHQIGSRRWANPRYIALMLRRYHKFLQKRQVMLSDEASRRKLQVPGVSMPVGLFNKIRNMGLVTERALRGTGSVSDELVMTYRDFLKYATYYLIYSKTDPEIITASDNHLGEQIARSLNIAETLKLIRGWSTVLERINKAGYITG